MKPLPLDMIEVEILRPGGPEVLEPRRVTMPRPAAGEVLIRVRAAGVNRPDVIQRLGFYPLPPGANPTPGLEVAGEIAEIGAGVGGFAVGDRVCALTNGGGYAEFCAVPAGQVLPVPDGMDDIAAAALPETFFTVWANLFMLGRAVRGETVLIHGGTGGIGTTALMLAREFGLKAFATAGSARKCDAVRALGADAINHREADFVEVIRKWTAGRGVDVVLDVMGASYLQRNISALALDGRLVIIGLLGGAVATDIPLAAIMARRASITGSLMRSRSDAEKSAIAAALHAHVWPVLAAGRCRPLVDRTFRLASAAEAHRHMESGEHIGKIVLEVQPDPIAV